MPEIILDETTSVESACAHLCTLVKENNIDEIKRIIVFSKAKAKKGYRWYDRPVENAVRDAILLNKKDIVELFLVEGVHANASAKIEKNPSAPEPFAKYQSEAQPLAQFAADTGKLDILRLLVHHGADIAWTNRFGDVEHIVTITEALKCNDTDMVEYLLNMGASANRQVYSNVYNEHVPSLIYAATNKNIQIVEALVNNGADVRVSMLWAIEKYNTGLKSSIDIIKTLLDYIGSYNFDNTTFQFIKDMDVTDCNFLGISFEGYPLTAEKLAELCAKNAEKALTTVFQFEQIPNENRREAIGKCLGKSIEKLGEQIDEKGHINLVSFAIAVEIGDEKTVLTRLEAKTPHEKKYGDDEVDKGLFTAVTKGHESIVKLLAKHPLLNKYQLAHVLNDALNTKYENIANYLADLQHDANSVDHAGNTMLHIAAKFGYIGTINKLLERGGVSLINQENSSHETPLIVAAKNYKSPITINNYTQIIALLLHAGADANYDKGYNSVLFYVVLSKQPEAVYLLLPHVNKTAGWYVRPLFEILTSLPCEKDVQILAALKENGADFNTKDRDGQTLLSRTIRQFFYNSFSPKQFNLILDRLTFLLENGANPNLANDNGELPLQLIKDKDCFCEMNIKGADKQVTELLKRFGAKLDNVADMKEKDTPIKELIRQRKSAMESSLAKPIDEKITSDAFIKLPLS